MSKIEKIKYDIPKWGVIISVDKEIVEWLEKLWIELYNISENNSFLLQDWDWYYSCSRWEDLDLAISKYQDNKKKRDIN